MKNVEMTVEGTRLTITVDLSKEVGTEGNARRNVLVSLIYPSSHYTA